MPTATETPKATPMPPAVGIATKPSLPVPSTRAMTLVSTLAMRMPSKMPMAPPMAEVVPASMMNWLRMSRHLAPRDFRMPISRVRSVTDTSMIFMIPMPPTSRLMAAMRIRIIIRVFSMESMASIISAEVMTM